MPMAGSSDKMEDKKTKVVGQWVLDKQPTSKAMYQDLVDERVDGKKFDVNALVQQVSEGSLDFNFAEDGTFTADEWMNKTRSKYKGDWVLKGSKLRVNQKFKGDVEEEDLMVGSVEGDKLKLIHEDMGLQIPLHFKRR